MHNAVCLGFDLALEALHDSLYELEKNMIGAVRSNTYQKDNSQARLHLFQSNSIFDANNLLLKGHSLLKTLKDHIGQASNHGEAIIGGVGDPGVYDFVCSGTELVIGVMSGTY